MARSGYHSSGKKGGHKWKFKIHPVESGYKFRPFGRRGHRKYKPLAGTGRGTGEYYRQLAIMKEIIVKDRNILEALRLMESPDNSRGK